MPTLDDTRRLEDAHAYRIHRVSRLLRRQLIGTLDGTPLTPEQFFLLFRLHEQDGRSQRELADPDLDDRSNITRQVAALQRAGLVTRRPDPRDARKQRVFLTSDGRALFERLQPAIVQTRRALFGDLPPEALSGLEQALAHLEATLR